MTDEEKQGNSTEDQEDGNLENEEPKLPEGASGEEQVEGTDPDGGGDDPEEEENPFADTVIPQFVEKEMKSSYIDYAMSVIVGRALPDVRDGLKPVHRRILYSMHVGGHLSTRSYTKSARIVGDVLGKYHPHGDMAVYDALVRMAQSFSLRYPLIDGQGNFGSVDGDSAAAMRYTESRLKKLAEEILEDIQKETVEFIPNYDASLKEPVVLPSKVPNLLINGSSGIAVGMTTNVPPHSLSEVVDATIHLIENPECSIADLMQIVKGPDFPTGGIIYGAGGIYSAYATGKGKIRVRARTEVQDDDKRKDRRRIIVTELPYQVNKSKLLEDIAGLVRDKKIEGISDLRDESDKDGMRIVLELKKGVIEEVVQNQLFKYTNLETTFGIINLALVDGAPKELSLKEILQHFVSHRFRMVTNRTKFDLRKARERAHILEGLIIALDNIDECIAIIKASKTTPEASQNLIARFGISVLQAKAILEMRLQRLTGLEMQSIKDEYARIMEVIKELEDILANEWRVYGIIKDELWKMKEKYGDERRSTISGDFVDIDVEDLIPNEQMVVTITSKGYIRRILLEEYKAQRRGGKGLIGLKTVEEDFPIDIFVTWSHDYLLFFSNKGKVYWLKTYKLPVGGRYAKGRAIVNLLPNMEQDELINTIIPVSEFTEDHYLIFATKNGIIKKTELAAYSRPRSLGIWAIRLREDDELINTRLCDGSMDVMMATKKGLAIKFREQDLRGTARATYGVIGIRLEEGDEVVSMVTVREDSKILTITENGFGKRTKADEYRKIRRGGKGVITIKVNERNGNVVSLMDATDEDEMVVTTKLGMVIRVPICQISTQSRNTMGVTIIKLNEGDKVTGIAKLKGETGETSDKDGDEDGKEDGSAAAADTATGDEGDASVEVPSEDGESAEVPEPVLEEEEKNAEKNAEKNVEENGED